MSRLSRPPAHGLRRTRHLIVAAAFCLAGLLLPLAAAARQGSLPSARPEEVGISSERLRRVSEVVQRYIESGQISGAVTVVARRGRVVYFEPHGLKDIEAKQPVRRDSMFRMASSTKPVTAIAVLMLVEEGKVRLSDPVSRFIPEFKEMKVAVTEPDNAEPRLVPAEREVTVLDLLTHRSGIASNGASQREVGRIIQAQRPEDTLADFMPRFAQVPLDFQPGTQWRYSARVGFDLLARIVEVASAQAFDRFMQERIFEPLGMHDTFFVVPDDLRGRQATLYRKTIDGLEKMDLPAQTRSRAYFSGSGGLISTAEDFFRFGQMLANSGHLNGKRLLSPRTVDLMTTNHVGETFASRGMGFALAGEVVLDPIRAGSRRSAGSYSWGGATGTHFWVDRKEGLVGVLLTQAGVNGPLYRDFENAVMQAIVE